MIPTLGADPCLLECLEALARQTFTGFRTVVVDNSGCGAIHRLGAARYRFRLVENASNVGFGEAVNRGFLAEPAEFLAVLNDDAIPRPEWLGELIGALRGDEGLGMAACRILQAGTERLDSAGLGIARDGSSKQVGRGAPAGDQAAPRRALIPSGCAAIYRKSALDETGLFEPGFFLYCEDTDLALRLHWAGWGCAYVPSAVVEHRYSRSAGAASAMKAYYVERNRLRVIARNFPASWLIAAPVFTAARYACHALAMLAGRGRAGEYRSQGQAAWRLGWIVVKAHLCAARDFPALMRQRASIASLRRVKTRDFAALLRANLISLWEVAAQ